MINSLMMLAVEANGVDADDETNARRQMRSSRSGTNGRRKDTDCFRRFRQSNGRRFGR
jgi:hypothetical protein